MEGMLLEQYFDRFDSAPKFQGFVQRYRGRFHTEPGFGAVLAFDAANMSLGLYSSVAANFQANNMYFMGVTSSAGDIAKLVFTDVNSNTGDTTGIDNVMFATRAGNNVPEPGALSLVGLALAGLALTRRRKA